MVGGLLGEGHTHIGGKAVKPPSQIGRIHTDTHTLLDPFSDDAARFKVNESRNTCFAIKEWFAVTDGPNQFALDKKGESFKALCDEAAAEINTTKSKMLAVMPDAVDSSDLLRSHTKRLREEALEKARQAGAHSRPKKQRSQNFLHAIADDK